MAPVAPMAPGVVPLHQAVPTLFVCLHNMYAPSDINLQEEPTFFEDICEDVMAEAGKHGQVVDVFVNKRIPDGKVYLKFMTMQNAIAAAQALNGRFFAGQQILAEFVSDHAYATIKSFAA
eukprot:GDKI01017673.1.p2 GENE.GDKI01017673.1~~GDKI01017673.1.p2  ORF type:complete len:120 (-),score=33.75 GDKI01017673.1:196-555(-)